MTCLWCGDVLLHVEYVGWRHKDGTAIRRQCNECGRRVPDQGKSRVCPICGCTALGEPDPAIPVTAEDADYYYREAVWRAREST